MICCNTADPVTGNYVKAKFDTDDGQYVGPNAGDRKQIKILVTCVELFSTER